MSSTNSLDRMMDSILDTRSPEKKDYDMWIQQLVADRHRQNLTMLNKYDIQKAWNAEQKTRAKIRKEERIKQLAQMKIRKLQEAIGVSSTTTAEEEENLPDFDAIDREMQRMQDARVSAEQAASREQAAIFNIQDSSEPIPIFDNPMENGDDSTAVGNARVGDI